MKHLKKILKRNLTILRKAYKKHLNSAEKNNLALWLTDNFHVIEKNAAAALRCAKNELPDANEDQLEEACAALCAHGVLPSDSEIIARLLAYSPSTASLMRLPFFLTYTLIAFAAEGVTADEDLTISAIKSLIRLSDTDFGRILFEVSETEKILCQDPAGVYRSMEEATKEAYRRAVCREARKTGTAETTVAVNALEKAKKENRHIGFFLPVQTSHRRAGIAVLILEALIPLFAGLLLSLLLKQWFLLPLLYLPLWEALRFVPDSLFGKAVKTQPLLKMDFSDGIPDEEKTVIAVSLLLPSAGKARELIPHIKDICLSNCRDNTAVCLLADLRSASTGTAPSDRSDIKAMKRVVNSLNASCGGKVLLAVRPRVFSPTENEYTGFERKRGAITSLVQYISGGSSDFLTIHGDEKKLLGAKYIMALDSDTQMPLGSLRTLVGTAAHPLNRPVVSLTQQRVVSGFGILSPRVETSVESANRTHFSAIMAGNGGLPAYSAAAGEKYQDFFGESIFSGKGLIDVSAFQQLMPDRFPEQKILSHDILEGILLRTGFAGDVSLTDSFPASESSYSKRLHRWIRGDIQNLPLLFPRRIPSGRIPGLGKWWLFDNVRRAVTPIFSLLGILLSLLMPQTAAAAVTAVCLLSAVLPDFISCLITLIRGGIGMLSRLYFSDAAPYALTCFLRAAVNAVLLPRMALCSLDAVLRALYRMLISKKHLLQWTTAADSERTAKTFALIKNSLPSAVFGVILLLFGAGLQKGAGILFLAGVPFSVFSANRKKSRHPALTDKEKNTLLSYCAATWKFYEKYCRESDHMLIPDNVQETPVYRVAHRTSPTNIGLMLCAFLAARDFDFISSDELYTMLSRSMASIEKLEKYKGNLYNWYDTRTLEILQPAFVSTVDSGNFLCCLVALKEGLTEYAGEWPALRDIIAQCSRLINGCDLGFLYDKRRNLFRIGYDAANGEMSASHFDLLMSEARMTSYFAVASGAVPVRHWESLGRTLSKSGRYTGPVSWSGTMFEYFMPAIFLPSIRNTLGGEALKFCIHCQKKRMRNKNIPYGISESGFYAFDQELNYQYKAHGVSKLSLRSAPNDETVISPYSSFLTICEDPHDSMNNLKKLEKLGMYGECGFFEAADFTKKRTDGQDFSIIRSCMAHHVGMSFLSAANALLDKIMQKRFLRDDRMAGGKSLLYERIPSDAKVYRNIERRDAPKRPERTVKMKNDYSGISLPYPNCHTLTNGEWTFLASDSGMSVSIYGNIGIFKRRSQPLSYPDGIFAAVKDTEGKILPFTVVPRMEDFPDLSAAFTENSVQYRNRSKALAICETVCVHPRYPAQLHTFSIRNKTKERKTLSLLIYAEPALSAMDDPIRHPAFFNLFTETHYRQNEKAITFTRKTDSKDKKLVIAAGFFDKKNFQYSFDREAVLEKNKGISALFEKDFSSSSESVDKCIAFQLNFTLPPHGSFSETLIFCGASGETEAINRLTDIRREGIPTVSKCAIAPFDASSIVGIYAKKIIERTFFGGMLPIKAREAAAENNGSRDDLWALGISGDFPIIAADVSEKETSDVTVLLQLHRKLRRIGMTTEMVFLSKEPESYESGLQKAIRQAPSDAFEWLGKRGGIFILNKNGLSWESLSVLTAAAVAYYPETQEETVHPYHWQPIYPAESVMKPKNLFLKQGYFISDPPYLPWSYILCNRNFGTLLTDSSLGYTWALNSHENKLTPWSNDTRAENSGERLILSIGGKRYDILKGASAFFKNTGAQYASAVQGVSLQTKVTVEGENLCKKISVTAENGTPQPISCSISYFIEPVLGDNPGNARFIRKEKSDSGVLAYSPYHQTFGGFLAVSSDKKCRFSWDKTAFSAASHEDFGDQSSIIAEHSIELPPKRKTTVTFYLSYAKERKAAVDMPFLTPKKSLPNRVEIETPDQELNRIFNDFLPNQIIGGRIFGRTGFYQCSGAFGFRDQLQDAMAVVLTHPEILKVQIFRCAAAQFTQGDVLHWFHPLFFHNRKILRGVRTRYSDDKLWLPLAVSEYCVQTGDFSILRAQVPYIEAPPLENGEKERFGEYAHSPKKSSLYRHCLKAIRHSCVFGAHSLPLIQGGDWNDSFNEVGILGKGESVWLALFLSYTARKFSVISAVMKDEATQKNLVLLADALLSAVDKSAWDGDHYLRCFYDDGTPMGKTGSKECAMDLLPQAWSVIASIPDRERSRTAAYSAYHKLVDKENGIIQLFTPAFTENGKRAGYVNLYPQGIRENGGQYSHGAVWLAEAFFRLREPQIGYELLNILNPAKKPSAIYKTEPYYMAGDVYAKSGMEGRGGWSLYTGSAGWFYRTVLEQMLGIRQIGGEIKKNPCLPIGFRESKVKITRNGETQEFIL